MSSIVTRLKLDKWLKSFQRLHGALEAYRAGLKAVGRRGLGGHRADQIVSERMRPNLLSHQFRRLAAQFVHLHRRLDRTQIQFVVPACEVELRQITFRELVFIEQVFPR